MFRKLRWEQGCGDRRTRPELCLPEIYNLDEQVCLPLV